MPLTKLVALVTGGGTGLGRVISLALAEAGCDVAINYSRSEADAQATVDAVRALGQHAVAVRADVANDIAVRQMIETVASDLGGLDILINNAGTTRYVPLADLEGLTDETWDTILSVNLKGPFHCARAAAPYLKRSGRGKIVNTASNSAFQPSGSSIPYMCSKAALVMLTKALATALAPEIQVNAIAPGWLDTRWAEQHIPEDVRVAVLSDTTHPPASLDELARLVVTLAETDSLTGQTIVVDRGKTLL